MTTDLDAPDDNYTTFRSSDFMNSAFSDNNNDNYDMTPGQNGGPFVS